MPTRAIKAQRRDSTRKYYKIYNIEMYCFYDYLEFVHVTFSRFLIQHLFLYWKRQSGSVELPPPNTLFSLYSVRQVSNLQTLTSLNKILFYWFSDRLKSIELITTQHASHSLMYLFLARKSLTSTVLDDNFTTQQYNVRASRTLSCPCACNKYVWLDFSSDSLDS